MATLNDIILTSAYDVEIKNGDFVVADSDQQSANLIIQLFPGNLKQFPQAGVGLINYLAGSSDNNVISQAVTTQLTTDGFTVQSCTVTGNGQIDIAATR